MPFRYFDLQLDYLSMDLCLFQFFDPRIWQCSGVLLNNQKIRLTYLKINV